MLGGETNPKTKHNFFGEIRGKDFIRPLMANPWAALAEPLILCILQYNSTLAAFQEHNYCTYL